MQNYAQLVIVVDIAADSTHCVAVYIMYGKENTALLEQIGHDWGFLRCLINSNSLTLYCSLWKSFSADSTTEMIPQIYYGWTQPYRASISVLKGNSSQIELHSVHVYTGKASFFANKTIWQSIAIL